MRGYPGTGTGYLVICSEKKNLLIGLIALVFILAGEESGTCSLCSNPLSQP